MPCLLNKREAAAGVQKGLRIVVDRGESMASLREILSERGRGEVRIALRLNRSQQE